MPQDITSYRIFIASPGGLDRERQAFRDAVASYNESEAIHRGAYFIPVGWELTLGGVGRPQDLINNDIRQCDYFVLLLWNRWGSPPHRHGRFSSGTEEEFHVATECLRDPALPMRQIVIYFKSPDPQQLSDPGEQLKRVLEFKKQLEDEKGHLYITFDVPESFQDKFRRDLGRWLRDHEKGLPALSASYEVPPAPTQLAVTPSDIPSTAELVAEAERLESEGKRTDAEAAFARAIVRGTDPDAFISYGHFLTRDGRLAQAEAIFERAVELAEALDSTEHILESLNALGRIFHTLSHWRRAETVHLKALALAEKYQILPSIADSYGNLGIVLEALHNLDKAEEMVRKSLEIEEQIGRASGMAADYLNLGNIYSARGDEVTAKAMYEKMIAISEEMSDPEGLSDGYTNLALLSRRQGNWSEAQELLDRALRYALEAEDLEGEASARLNLGSVFLHTGDWESSRTNNMLALEQATAIGSLEMIGKAHWNLGLLAVMEKNTPAAVDCFRNAVDAFEKAGLDSDAQDGRTKLLSLEAQKEQSGKNDLLPSPTSSPHDPI